jgi:pimeloyl-ACP methyl ester carboxylesterase
VDPYHSSGHDSMHPTVGSTPVSLSTMAFARRPVVSAAGRSVVGMNSSPIVLVPGFWLGAWAWDDVVAALRADGHEEVTALTLPGLESSAVDRSAVTFEDHVDSICRAVQAHDRPVVLAVHSGSGTPGYVASDRVPERIAAMVYVDTFPFAGPMEPDFVGVEMPLPSPEDLARNESLEGLSQEQLDTFRRRAVPEPGDLLRGSAGLTNSQRLDIPTTMLCTSFLSDEIQEALTEGQDWLSALAALRNVTYVDLPTSHWPMWSRPKELAGVLGKLATAG